MKASNKNIISIPLCQFFILLINNFLLQNDKFLLTLIVIRINIFLGTAIVNISVLKNRKGKAVKFSTLEKICEVLARMLTRRHFRIKNDEENV